MASLRSVCVAFLIFMASVASISASAASTYQSTPPNGDLSYGSVIWLSLTSISGGYGHFTAGKTAGSFISNGELRVFKDGQFEQSIYYSQGDWTKTFTSYIGDSGGTHSWFVIRYDAAVLQGYDYNVYSGLVNVSVAVQANQYDLTGKAFTTLDKSEMISRYKADKVAYETGNYPHGSMDSSMRWVVSQTEHYTPWAVLTYFNDRGYSLAVDHLNHFLTGNGDPVNVEIGALLNRNPSVKKSLSDSACAQDYAQGTVEIHNNDDMIWTGLASDSWDNWDDYFAYGGMKILWQRQGNTVKLFVDNLYAYHILSDSARNTYPIYYEMGKEVLAGGFASDFYMHGRASFLVSDLCQ